MKTRSICLALTAILLFGCAAKEDKDKLPPQLVSYDAGPNIVGTARIASAVKTVNEAIPHNVHEVYAAVHLIKNSGGKATGLSCVVGSEDGVVEPVDISVSATAPTGDEKTARARSTASASFVKASSGIWTASLDDCAFANGWIIALRINYRALKEGSTVTLLKVIPIGGAKESGAEFEDNHSVLGYG